MGDVGSNEVQGDFAEQLELAWNKVLGLDRLAEGVCDEPESD